MRPADNSYRSLRRPARFAVFFTALRFTAFRARVALRVVFPVTDLRTLAIVLLVDFAARLTALFAVFAADLALFIAAVALRDADFAPALAALPTAPATFAALPIASPTTSPARSNVVSLRLRAMTPPFVERSRGYNGSSNTILRSVR